MLPPQGAYSYKRRGDSASRPQIRDVPGAVTHKRRRRSPSHVGAQRAVPVSQYELALIASTACCSGSNATQKRKNGQRPVVINEECEPPSTLVRTGLRAAWPRVPKGRTQEAEV